MTTGCQNMCGNRIQPCSYSGLSLRKWLRHIDPAHRTCMANHQAGVTCPPSIAPFPAQKAPSPTRHMACTYPTVGQDDTVAKSNAKVMTQRDREQAK